MTKRHPLALPYILAGGIAFLFAFLLVVEKMATLAQVDYVPPCSIDPFISCGSVMKTWQASLFGFPNPLIGVAGFAIVVTIGFALLAGAKFSTWFWRGMLAGLSGAFLFVLWLFHESVFEIGALCQYCMVVWAMTIPLFFLTWKAGVEEKAVSFGRRVDGFIKKYPLWMTLGVYVLIVLSILIRHWDYWSRLV